MATKNTPGVMSWDCGTISRLEVKLTGIQKVSLDTGKAPLFDFHLIFFSNETGEITKTSICY